MSNFFVGLMNMTSVINPILTFLLLVSAISFLIYLRKKAEGFFEAIKRISIELERISNILDRNNRY